MEVLVALVVLAVLLAPIAALVIAFSTRQRVHALDARLEALERAIASLRAHAEPARPPAATEAALPPRPAPEPAAPPPPWPPARTLAREDIEPAGEAPPARVGGDWRQWESWLGGTWLNRVGALVLVLGIGFFLKYAFDHRWIRPAGRVTLGLVGGVALLLLGERLQRAAYRIPAQGVVAAGIATLYLSIYAAYGFYQLIGQLPAFAFMVLVTATGLTLAIHHDARAIATLASLGGFLTPIVLGADRDAAIALFTYLAVLDAGVLVSAYWRRWPELQAVAFVFTQSLYVAWFERWYHPASAPGPQRAVALTAATVFFVLFALTGPVEAAGRRFALRLDRVWHPTALLILAAPVAYFLAARAVLAPELRTWLSLLCLLLAAFYASLGRWATATGAGGAPLALFHWAIGLAFLTLTFPVQFTEHGTTIAWSVEGAAIVWGGFRLRERRVRLAGLAVLALATVRWLALASEGGPHWGTFVLDHPALLPTVFFAVAAAATAWVYRQHEPASGTVDEERYAWPVLVLVAVLSAALLLTLEVSGHQALGLSRAAESVLTTLIWLAAAITLLGAAPSDRTRTLLGASTLLLALVGLKAALVDTDRWRSMAVLSLPVWNVRFATGLVMTATYIKLGRMVDVLPIPPERRAQARATAVAAAALFLLWHLSAEIVLTPFDSMPPGELTMARHMGLSILWTLYAFAAMGAGILRRQAALRFGALGLFALTVVKVFLVDLSRLDAGYRILSFIVLGGLLIVSSFLYTKYRARILGEAA